MCQFENGKWAASSFLFAVMVWKMVNE